MGFLFNTIYAIAETLAPLDNLGAAASFDSFINEAQGFKTLHFQGDVEQATWEKDRLKAKGIACRLEMWGNQGNVYTQRKVK